MAEVQHHENDNEHNDHNDLVLLNRENLVNFVMDMLHQSVEQSQFHSFSPFTNLRIPDPWSHLQNEHDDLEWENTDTQINDHDILNRVFVSQHNAIPETNQDLSDYNENDYEIVFGQFGEASVSNLSHPPASIFLVENLLSVMITNQDVENENVVCAVCINEIVVGQMAKQLPCAHWYHGDCIIPWLEIKNTCPVCRYELATDDFDYERKKAERVVRAL